MRGLAAIALVCGVGSACSYDRVETDPPVTGELAVLDRSVYAADGTDVAVVRVVVRDFAGQAVAGYPVLIEASDPGSVTLTQPEAVTNAGGEVVARLTAATAVEVVVSARLDPGGFNRPVPQRPRLAFVAQRAFTARLAPPVEVAVGSEPCSVGVGDFDHDGRADLVTASCASPALSVLLGSGGASFAPAVRHLLEGVPRAIAVADLDGDGHDDVIAALAEAASVVISYGAAGGGFRAEVARLATDPFPSALAIADLDGVAPTEIIVSHANGGSLSVLRSSRAGVLEVVGHLDGVALAPGAIALGRLNEDASLDVAVADRGGAAVPLLMNDGTGALTAAEPWSCGPASALVAGELDGHPGADLALLDASAGTVAMRWSGAATSPCTAEAFASAAALAVVDVNRDRRGDLLIASAPTSGAGSLVIRLGAEGGFDGQVEHSVGLRPSALATGDLDADGDPDIVVANRGAGTVSILVNAAGAQP